MRDGEKRKEKRGFAISFYFNKGRVRELGFCGGIRKIAKFWASLMGGLRRPPFFAYRLSRPCVYH